MQAPRFGQIEPEALATSNAWVGDQQRIPAVVYFLLSFFGLLFYSCGGIVAWMVTFSIGGSSRYRCGT